MGTVGSVTVGVKADSTQFDAAMAKNQATINRFAQSAQVAGKTAAGAFGEAASGSVIVSQGLAQGTAAATTFATAAGAIRTALLAAFPLAGALAILDVLEKIADNKFQKAAVELGDSFRTMNLAAETSIDTLKLSTAKMQEQIDLLSGKRPNTLAEDLANASLAADKLASSLDADNRKIAQLLQQQRLGALQGLLTNRAGTSDVEGSVNSFDEDLAHLAAKYQHSVRTGSPDAAADLKALDDKRLAAMRFQSDQLEQRQRLQAQGTGPNQDANIAVLTGFGDTLVNQADLEADEKNNKATGAKLKKMEEDKKFSDAQKAAQAKAQRELLQQDEEDEKARNAFNKLTISEEIQFWQDRIGAFTKGSEQFIQVQDKINDLIARRPSLFAENKKNQASAGKSQVQGDDLLGAGAEAFRKLNAEQVERAARSQAKYNEEVNRGAEIQAKAQSAFEESSIRLSVMQGTMSKLEAAQAMAALHAHDHAEAIQLVNEALQRQIDLINDAKLSDADRTDAIRNANKSAANQTAAVDGVFRTQGAQDKAAISDNTISGAVKKSLDEMVQSFNDMAARLKDVIPRSIDSLNGDIVRAMTGQGRKSDFGHTFTQAGQGLLKTGLERAEGGFLGSLGLGGTRKPAGTASDPTHTIIVGQGGGAAGLSGNGLFRPFFGGQQSQGGAQSGGGSILGQLFHSFLGGGGSGGGESAGAGLGDIGIFGGGGDFMANRPMIVGDKGPELMTPGFSGHITPNNMLGSGGESHVYHIDARGSNDPMAVHAAVARALPHAVSASVQANHQAKMRSPGGR